MGQNSRFDLTRAIVEKGTFEISSYASNTGDLGLRDGKVYSNKSPVCLYWPHPFMPSY
jgi:hypothetical protein